MYIKVTKAMYGDGQYVPSSNNSTFYINSDKIIMISNTDCDTGACITCDLKCGGGFTVVETPETIINMINNAGKSEKLING